MLPRSRPPIAAPLLSFPPSPPSLPAIDHSPSPSQSSRSLLSTTAHSKSTRVIHVHSKCYKILALTPLGFIYALLLFSFYSVAYSLCFDYLLLQRGERVKGLAFLGGYAWLLVGCGGSLWMCYWRNERNYVPSTSRDTAGRERDEEEMIGEGFEEEENEEEGREGDALLNGRSSQDTNREEGGGKRRNGRTRAIQVKSDGTKRFCRKCNLLKPDRAHHCSSCNRCVFKMDHHCPWLGGGCAGYANYKFFLQFLIYTGFLGLYIAFICFNSLINYTSSEPDGFEMAPISWAIAALLGVIFGSAVGLFGCYHMYLAANNRTTIEAMESPTTFLSTLPPPHLLQILASHSPPSPNKPPPAQSQRIQQLVSRLSSKQKLRLNKAKRKYNVYDLGWRGNLREVFLSRGDENSRRNVRERERGEWEDEGKEIGKGKWWEWIVPWGSPAGDGYTFPINQENLRKLEEISREVWAEVEAEERERGDFRDRANRGIGNGQRYESGLTREGGFSLEGDEDSEDEDERPLRRA